MSSSEDKTGVKLIFIYSCNILTKLPMIILRQLTKDLLYRIVFIDVYITLFWKITKDLLHRIGFIAYITLFWKITKYLMHRIVFVAYIPLFLKI